MMKFGLLNFQIMVIGLVVQQNKILFIFYLKKNKIKYLKHIIEILMH